MKKFLIIVMLATGLVLAGSLHSGASVPAVRHNATSVVIPVKKAPSAPIAPVIATSVPVVSQAPVPSHTYVQPAPVQTAPAPVAAPVPTTIPAPTTGAPMSVAPSTTIPAPVSGAPLSCGPPSVCDPQS